MSNIQFSCILQKDMLKFQVLNPQKVTYMDMASFTEVVSENEVIIVGPNPK